jgi:ribonuclease-3 family protein
VEEDVYYISTITKLQGVNTTQNLSTYKGNPRNLSPITLAFVGDGVYELLVRERLLSKGSLPANKLHSLAVKKVRAAAQAKAYARLEAVLEPEEADILRRGRNANTRMTPKSASLSEYRMATGVEALFGYLYLCGRTQRLLELYEHISEAEGEG